MGTFVNLNLRFKHVMLPSAFSKKYIFICIILVKIALTIAEIPEGYVKGSECYRTCNGTNLKCYFEFKIENFYSMSRPCFKCPDVIEDCFRPDCIVAGGVRRTLTVANRQLPGPAIQICHGDRVRVLVTNYLFSGESTTIHWHGLHLSNDQYMDGVPFVTQCPILVDNSFTYDFYVDTSGSHFWHSHLKSQRGEGLFGSFIVRVPNEENPHISLYDYDLPEHVMLIGDWSSNSRIDMFNAWAMTESKMLPTGILINGLGYQSGDDNRDPKTPLAIFNVKKGKKYRFRLLGVGFVDCPTQVTIDNHTLTVISTDGVDIQPVEVTSLLMNAGERFDFILNANQEAHTYWIRFKGFASCKNAKVFGIAKLRYENAPSETPNEEFPNYDTAVNDTGTLLNPRSELRCETESITIDKLKALNNLESKLATAKPAKQIYLSFQMNLINSPKFHREPYYDLSKVGPNNRAQSAQIDHISFKPSPFPLLPQRNQIDENVFCNANTIVGKNCTQKYCECTHVIQVDLNDVVEMIFIEPNTQPNMEILHPIHLHGNNFRVIGRGEIGANLTTELVMDLDRKGHFNRNLVDAPVKDTVNIEAGGYVIVRFVANNPGFWLLHCHIDVHSVEGMELVLQVGNHSQMPEAPNNFPTCQNFDNIV